MDESKLKMSQLPLSFEHVKFHESEYYVYNVQHQFSYLLDHVFREIDSLENRDNKYISLFPMADQPLSQNKMRKIKVLVLIEFDLDDLEATFKNIVNFKKNMHENKISYLGLVLAVEKVIKYRGYEEKLDFIQQLIRSSAMNLPNSMVASLSSSRPDPKFTKYLNHLLGSYNPMQYDLEKSGDSSDKFSPDILSIESLFIPIHYDSSLKIHAVNDRFPVNQFENISLNQIPNLFDEIKSVLDDGYSEVKEDDSSIRAIARDEQDLLANIKVVIDKLTADRQNINTNRANFKEISGSSKLTKPIGTSAETSAKASNPRMGGLVASASETKYSSSLSTLLNDKDALSSSAGSNASKSTSKYSTALTQDSEDMSAKIAKLLEQSKTVKEKFTSLPSLNSAAVGFSSESSSENSNEMLSAYFQSLLKK